MDIRDFYFDNNYIITATLLSILDDKYTVMSLPRVKRTELQQAKNLSLIDMGHEEMRTKFYSILYTLAASPSLGGGGSRQHKRNNKDNGVLLRSSTNDKGPGRVWMALLEQQSPSSPIFHNLCHFTDAISPTAPNTGLPL